MKKIELEKMLAETIELDKIAYEKNESEFRKGQLSGQIVLLKILLKKSLLKGV
jgi:hypothetical protein